MKPEAQDWIEIGDHDLGSARSLLRDGFASNAAYFCQQAVEKLLKGILTNAAVDFPKTHDLSELADLADLDLTGDHRILLNRLTDHAVRSRYPGSHYNEKEVQGMLEETESLYQWLRQTLS